MDDILSVHTSSLVDGADGSPVRSPGITVHLLAPGWRGETKIVRIPLWIGAPNTTKIRRASALWKCSTHRQVEQGQIDGIETIDVLLTQELSLQENRRIKAALRMARRPVIKTIAGLDFSFQPSLHCNHIMALAGAGLHRSC